MISASISEEVFISAYFNTKEATSPSLSGRHIGHYKSILNDPTLVYLHATMMSLPFQHGFEPDQWTNVTDIMLEKYPGNA
jgi:hypothetical protein